MSGSHGRPPDPRPPRSGRGPALLRREPHRPGLPRRRARRRHPRQQHLPAEFIHENLLIQSNLIDAAHTHGVDRLLFLGSSCIYPKHAPQPMREDALLTGLLEPTNEPYAIAKIAGIKMCESYNRQYGRRYRSVMPTKPLRPERQLPSRETPTCCRR